MDKRLRQFVDYLRTQGLIKNDADFAARMRRSKSSISEILSGHRAITERLAAEMCIQFPQLNPGWLTDEDCTQMLIDSPDANQGAVAQDMDLAALIRLINQQNEVIQQLASRIERMAMDTRDSGLC